MKNLIAALVLVALTVPALADYPLEHRSSFDVASTTRNPFWPIGYTRKGKVVKNNTTAVVATSISPEAFSVTSILLGSGLPLAVINGRDLAVGDTLSVDGVNVRVESIGDGHVKIRHMDQVITVYLKTPKLEASELPTL